MRLDDFQFELPAELIAQRPPERRGDSRLLRLDGRDGTLRDGVFADLEAMLRSGDLLVLNDTRVIPARLFGHKASGGRVELLLERLLDDRRALVQLRASRAPKAGAELIFDGDVSARVRARVDALFELEFNLDKLDISTNDLLGYFRRYGRTPLPPYIERNDDAPETQRADDRERYQTVFARRDGAVAAPTAGLHFDQTRLQRLREAGVELAYITLHVGAGTFQPLRVERVETHKMHAESVSVSAEVCAAIAATRARGGRVIAVGTTVVRSLESAAAGAGTERCPQPFSGDTELFIYPGYRFQCVDAMVTNFHLPGSSLLVLVSAFAGREAVLAAYRHAVEQRYRFFSYGDAMFIIGSEGTL